MVEGEQDTETAQLAAEIAGDAAAFTDVGNPELASTPEQKAAAEREAEASKPPGEGDKEPPASKEPPGDGDGDGEGGEKPETGEQEDPFKDLAGKPDEVVRVLLEHPVLGPILQHWSDSGVAAQVQAHRDRDQPALEAQAQRTAAERQEDEHFSEMSPEEIHEEIAKDEKQAAAYARFQQRKESAGQPNADGIAQASKVYSYASRILSVNKVLEGSGLSVEDKAKLEPKNFTHLGPEEGIVAWGSAVFDALVARETEKGVQARFDDEWETEKEERLAELDSDRPPTARGRRAAGTPSLMGTDSSVLLEDALSEGPKKGSKV